MTFHSRRKGNVSLSSIALDSKYIDAEMEAQGIPARRLHFRPPPPFPPRTMHPAEMEAARREAREKRLEEENRQKYNVSTREQNQMNIARGR